MLDALIEGHFILAALDTDPHDRSITVDAVNRITASPPGPNDAAIPG